ncbi:MULTISPECIES: hypothetical protein [Methylobacterium]|uniref:Uncharacterized protein n=1 Tax=Methylobacterium jeotgali TaxID=381630 RepID=A0ABQ4SZS9_9HYPH|nr:MULTISPECIES: hypothetical protein [Methylobacterium]PIU06878.1 MAG: hypothetical protein COT56_07020 [Methylobacterium sp. CG09_land_8_20_14_0_10_71_15]PIU16090.1 MAG: hypothetical protein COT28_01340 [Methylobacterium sp. CG08_land_8_20_14_0_20_71_15]GBU19383.1 hypothetical protein AwMethylo_35980 [Methylobacterium sp.]GJE08592.1 hypothetical protein AOPFMNJM_3935 [Methylobacterium jeotgali]
MGWAVGYDDRLSRDVGYGVPAKCDHPGCDAEIDRGLAHICGGDPYGGEHGCGLHFCGSHLFMSGRRSEHPGRPQLCEACYHEREPFPQKPDVPEWLEHKLSAPSWEEWRTEHPAEVAAARLAVSGPVRFTVFSVQGHE